MAVTLTEKAANEIKRIISEDDTANENTMVRIGVADGGCSGFQYSFHLDSNYDEANDSKDQQHGVNVVVDRKSAMYIEGTIIDFHDGLDQRGFKFQNPNAVRSCGCGSSFQA